MRIYFARALQSLIPGASEIQIIWRTYLPSSSYQAILTHFSLPQANLVCSFPLDSLPCEEAPLFYDGPDSINSKFGEKIEEDYDY